MHNQLIDPKDIVSALRKRYITAITLVALLAIVGQIVVQIQLQQQSQASYVINLAGRQRMFSQRLSKVALQIQNQPAETQDYREELAFVMNLWSQTHQGLQEGDSILGLPRETNREVLQMFAEIEAPYQQMIQAGEELLDHLQSEEFTKAEITPPIETILAHEATFLEGMNRIVFRYDQLARNQVNTLQMIEFSLLMILLFVLGGEILFVFQPAVQNIKKAFIALQKSEKKFRALLEYAPEAIIIANQERQIILINKQATSIFGYAPSEIIGQPLEILLPEKSRKNHSRMWHQEQNKPISRPMGQSLDHMMGQRKDGKRFPIEVGLSFIEDKAHPKEQNQTLIINYVTDITKRKQAEDSLRRSEELYRLLAQNIPNSDVYIFNSQLKHLLAEGSEMTRLGLSKEEIEGKTVSEIFPPEMVTYLEENYRQALAGELVRREYHFQDYIYYHQFIPLKNEEDDISWGIALSQNITELKQTEIALFQRDRYQTALVEIQKILLASPPKQQLYEEVLSHLGEATEVSRLHIYENHFGPEGELLTSKRAEWCAEGIKPTLENDLWQNLAYDSFNPYWLETLSEGEPIIAAIDQTPEKERQLLEAVNVISFLLIPLLVNKKFFGFISFSDCTQYRDWDMEAINLLWAAASSISLYHERRRAEIALQATHDELAHRVSDLAILNDIAQTVASITDLQATLENVSEMLSHLFGATGTIIFLFNEAHTKLTIKVHYSHNHHQKELIDQTIPLTYLAENELSMKEEFEIITREIKNFLCQEGEMKSFINSPLVVRGKIIGIISSCTDRTEQQFSKSERELAETIASQIAGAIENARLFDQEQHQRQLAEQQAYQLSQLNEELQTTLEHLQATQNELIQAEKMAALGQLIAGVAHEINTPLGAIQAAIDNINESLNQSILNLPKLLILLPKEEHPILFELLTRSVENKQILSSKEERKKRRAMKRHLSQYGFENADFFADVLTDIGIYDRIEPFLPFLRKEQASFLLDVVYKLVRQRRNSDNIKLAVERASKIVFALKNYAHYEHTNKKSTVDIKNTLETVLTIYHNQLKQGVEVIKTYEDIPPISCYPDELNQVWTNLIHNALQAMKYKGVLEISLRQTGEKALISITDNGSGIPKEIQDKIFEPFFTTKPAGEGSGLGLDIVQKIIEKHNGNIEVESRPGRTTFQVQLPL